MKPNPSRLAPATLAVGDLILASLALGGTAYAFGGCVDSPENPTWILAGIGAVAAGTPWLRAVVKRHRNK